MAVSQQHALIAHFFKEALPSLLRWADMDDLAAYADDVDLVDPTFTEVEPVESRADVLVRRSKGFRFFAIGEVQTTVDPRKDRVWPWYWAQAHLREECRGVLLVIATSPRVARWARRIAKKWLGSPMNILVIDSSNIPTRWSPEEVREDLPGAMMALLISSKAHSNHALSHLIWQEIQRRKIHLEFDEAAYNRYTMFLMNSTSAAWRREIMEHDMAYTNWFEEQVELRLKNEREETRKAKEKAQEAKEKAQEAKEEAQAAQKAIEATQATMRTLLLRRIEKSNQRLTPESYDRLQQCTDDTQLLQWFDWIEDHAAGTLELP